MAWPTRNCTFSTPGSSGHNIHPEGEGQQEGRGVTALSTYSVKVQDSLLTFHFAFMPRIQRDHTLLQFHNNLSRGRFCLGLFKTGKSLTQIRNLEKKSKLKILSVPDQMPLNAFHSGSGADLYTVFWNMQEDETHWTGISAKYFCTQMPSVGWAKVGGLIPLPSSTFSKYARQSSFQGSTSLHNQSVLDEISSTNTHTHPYTHIYTHTHTHTYLHTHTYTHIYTHSYTHTSTHTLTHTHTQTSTPTHIYTHTHTHLHTVLLQPPVKNQTHFSGNYRRAKYFGIRVKEGQALNKVWGLEVWLTPQKDCISRQNLEQPDCWPRTDSPAIETCQQAGAH